MAEMQIAGARAARLLLVEDNPDDVDITRRAFERAKIGNPLTVVEDGQAALDLLYRNCLEPEGSGIDLVLLDLELPKVDGRAVMRAIWADKRLRRIPGDHLDRLGARRRSDRELQRRRRRASAQAGQR